MTSRVPVSFLVPVRNEEANLARCLAAIAWAGEVVVVDSASTDRTAAIAAEHGAEVVQFHFNGTWPKKKNWALETVAFRHDWIFILDADEVLPPETEAEVRAIVEDPACPHDGFWINRRFMFLGTWLRHAYYPNWNLRLVRRGRGSYERLAAGPTNSGDNEVHEHIVVRGSTGRLRAEMDHYAFPSVDVFVEKHNRYSNWEARVAVEGDDPGAAALQHGRVAWKRRVKTLARRLPFRPTLRFLYVYLWQRGFLDGRAGFHFARLHGMYELLSVVKEYELRRGRGR
jgi:glycosyltransferase involved in cell wall biosynthesis